MQKLVVGHETAAMMRSASVSTLQPAPSKRDTNEGGWVAVGASETQKDGVAHERSKRLPRCSEYEGNGLHQTGALGSGVPAARAGDPGTTLATPSTRVVPITATAMVCSRRRTGERDRPPRPGGSLGGRPLVGGAPSAPPFLRRRPAAVRAAPNAAIAAPLPPRAPTGPPVKASSPADGCSGRATVAAVARESVVITEVQWNDVSG